VANRMNNQANIQVNDEAGVDTSSPEFGRWVSWMWNDPSQRKVGCILMSKKDRVLVAWFSEQAMYDQVRHHKTLEVDNAKTGWYLRNQLTDLSLIVYKMIEQMAR